MKTKKNNSSLNNFISTENQEKVRETFEERKDEKKIEKDLRKLQDSLDKTKKDFEDFKKEQNIRLIEFLGIFTAILAFITISGKIVIDNLNMLSILMLIPVFAVLLMLFVISIDSLIVKDNKKQFWLLLVFLLIISAASIYLSVKFGLLTT